MHTGTIAFKTTRTNSATELRSLRGQQKWSAVVVVAVATALSALVQCSPTAQSFLEFDRIAIGSGQWWRLLTGNFVHYDGLHAAANLGAFALLSWMAIGRSSQAMLVVPLSTIAVGTGIYVWAVGTVTYRGISGVDCAILAWLLVTMAIQDSGWRAAAWISVLVLMAVKSICETVTGQVLLPTSAPRGVEVVNVTHLIGLATGTFVAGLATLAPMLVRRREDCVPCCTRRGR